MPPHTTFHNITIHTAKCDLCNLRNKDILKRCTDCGWSICTPCWIRRGDNGTHVINVGNGTWGADTVEAAPERTNVPRDRERGLGDDAVGRNEHRDERHSEGSEEGEITEGDSDGQDQREGRNTGKGKERATEVAESMDIEMEDAEDDDFERARQESMAASTRMVGRSNLLHGEGSSTRTYDDLLKSGDFSSISSSPSILRGHEEPLPKHRKFTRKNDQPSSAAIGSQKEVKDRRPSHASPIQVRKPPTTATFKPSPRPKPTNTRPAATSAPRPKPKLQIRVPRARKPPPSRHSSPSVPETANLQPSSTSNLSSTATMTSSQTPGSLYTNASIDLLLQAASVLDSQRSSYPSVPRHDAQLVAPPLMPPESFHSESSFSASGPYSPPELVEQTFYSRSSPPVFGGDEVRADEGGTARNEEMNEENPEVMGSTGGRTSGVAPRLKRLYWDAAIVKDRKGRVWKFGGV
ncbi:MAG: hypothetical protein M1836_008125 [Candelina mexicana]|nr:MAG: hypothetical protein M1836_008125 [Candelina mexicana]